MVWLSRGLNATRPIHSESPRSVEMQRWARWLAGSAVPGADVAVFTHRDQGSAVRAERKIEDRREVVGGPNRVHELRPTNRRG